jgi:hypothetical protein
MSPPSGAPVIPDVRHRVPDELRVDAGCPKALSLLASGSLDVEIRGRVPDHLVDQRLDRRGALGLEVVVAGL